MKSFSITLLVVTATISLYSQVSIEPLFPKVTDNVIVTFDATLGNGALEGVNQVYAHTGLITEESTTPTDWKYVQGNWGQPDNRVKMTPIGNNQHQLSYIISDYYGVPSSEKVEKLAFVFRNANGSKVGRASDGSDIYTQVFSDESGLLLNVIEPMETNNIINALDSIHVKAVTSGLAMISVFDNEILIHETQGTELDVKFILPSDGTHDIKITATNDTNITTKSFRFIINPTVHEEDIDIPHGINYTSDTSVILALYAPSKSFVYVLGSFNGYLLDENYFMNFSPSNDLWWIELNGLTPTIEYGFQYYVDAEIKIGDPYSEKILDPWNDKYIEEEVYPNLIEYPTNKTNGIVSIIQTSQGQYNWSDEEFQRPKKSNLIIYELLMRDFLGKHSYEALTDTLDYLEKLGINAIELMPVNEFEGNRGWGYNPSYHLALDKYYGTPEAFKIFIDEAHSRGIAVILDVVYNHAFSQSPLAQLYWDQNGFKPTPSNPWLNVNAKHPFNVGYDFNHESEATKYFVDRALQYWTEEFHIDGFRFDLSKGFTQKNSTDNNQMSAYDQSRINILTHYANTLWALDEDIYVILEHFATNSEEKVLVEKGMMVWGNNNHQYAEASMGYGSNLSGASYKSRGFSNPGLVSYIESHDEERNMYKNITWGRKLGSYNIKEQSTALARAGLAAVFHMMIPGPKMIWQFGELGYDFSINRCEDGSINDDCRLSPKPIKWDYKYIDKRKNLFDIYSRMNQLRKNRPIFETDDYSLSVNSFLKKIALKSSEEDMLLIGNFGLVTSDIQSGFTKTGTWHELFSNDSLVVSDVNMNISLEAGEYRLYSTIGLSTNSSDQTANVEQLKIYPNPTQDIIFIEGSEFTTAVSWCISDITGRRLLSGELHGNKNISLAHLNSGMYIFQLSHKSVPLQTIKVCKY